MSQPRWNGRSFVDDSTGRTSMHAETLMSGWPRWDGRSFVDDDTGRTAMNPETLLR